MQCFQPREDLVSSVGELCRRGKVARLLSLVLLPEVQLWSHLGSKLISLLISLSSRRHLFGWIKEMWGT